MSETRLLIPEYVMQDWLDALRTREPRALELAYALGLSLPETAETHGLKESTHAAQVANPLEIADEVRELIRDGYEKYDALREGDFLPVDLGNPNVAAFERRTDDERLLLVNNLARVPQPIKFREYANKEGWDILNRVEFTFPARAQIETYEFLWLLVE